MATRCNIRVRFNTTERLFYRHLDGYPSCAGKDLVDLIDMEVTDEPTMSDFTDFCNTIVEDYGCEEVPVEAGDIEWYYDVSIDEAKVSCYSVDWRTGAKMLVHDDLATTGDFN